MLDEYVIFKDIDTIPECLESIADNIQPEEHTNEVGESCDSDIGWTT